MQRIRDGFAMPDLTGPIVAEKTAWYAARPDYLKRTFERSRRYLFHIVEEIERRGMPTELALLPMVESSFNPMAYSRAHASGLWQFIPGTGKRYELTQNWWYDGRRDIVASTGAALWAMENGMAGCVGVSNQTDFLRATTDGVLIASATPIHRGRTQQLWQVEVTREDNGKLVARGQVRLQNINSTEF